MDFEDIRSYHDIEVPAVITGMLADKDFCGLIESLYGAEKAVVVKQVLASCRSKFDIQDGLVKPFVAQVIKDSTDGFDVSGFENVPRDKACLFISNHRNIILDSALLSWYLHTHGLSTVEIAIGSNLMYFPWIEKLVKLNKSFVIRRGITGRALLQSSMQASNYIKHKLLEDNQSIWIAQREGRAKDGDDRTQPSLIHMLMLAAENKEYIKLLNSYSIVPASVSYEFDPCDVFKAQEVAARENEIVGFEKKVTAYNEMAFEVMWPKGKVHYHFGKPLDLSRFEGITDKNELSEAVAGALDSEIHAGFRITSVNKAAAACLDQLPVGETVTEEDVAAFRQYVMAKVVKFGLDPELTMEYTARQYAKIYSNYLKAFSR